MHMLKGQDPTMPRITAFMRQNLQSVFGVGEGTNNAEHAGPSGVSSVDPTSGRSATGSIVEVAIRPDEMSESVAVDIAEAGQALETETSTVKLDITTLLSVDIRPSEDMDFGEPAEIKVAERQLTNAREDPEQPLIAVTLSVVPETVRTAVLVTLATDAATDASGVSMHDHMFAVTAMPLSAMCMARSSSAEEHVHVTQHAPELLRCADLCAGGVIKLSLKIDVNIVRQA